MSGTRSVRSRIDSLRFRFGTWRRNLFRPRVPVRRLVERRPSTEVTISVVVPVKDAGPELAGLITRMRAQKGFRSIEVVIVDSGSTDGSAETAEALGARLVRIAPEEFSHSHARNLGAERASGDYILFTVQDAMPPSDGWLLAMFSSLARHDAAAISCGEQPRPDSDLFYRVISWYHDRFMSPRGGDAVLTRAPGQTPMERRRNAQISDTACLIRRDLFLRYRHRGNFAEDLDLGLRLTADAYRLVYLSSPRIIHSHDRPAYYHLRRSYVEQLTLWDLVPDYPMPPEQGDSVPADVVGSIAALDVFVMTILTMRSAPRRVAELRFALQDGLGTPVAEPAGCDASAYLDQRTRALVERLACVSAVRDRASDAPGHLVPSTIAAANMICDYLEQESAQSLDAAVLEEFKAAIYKGWAVHCGVLLASVYRRCARILPEWMRDLHEELTAGV